MLESPSQSYHLGIFPDSLLCREQRYVCGVCSCVRCMGVCVPDSHLYRNGAVLLHLYRNGAGLYNLC